MKYWKLRKRKNDKKQANSSETKEKGIGEMMEVFLERMLEASLLVGMILIIRKVFMGKIRYGLIYALWGVVLLRFLIPVNMIATPFSIENILPDKSLVWEVKGLSEQTKENYKNKQEILIKETGRGGPLSKGSDKSVSEKQKGIVSIGSEEKDSFYEQGKTVIVPIAGKNSEKIFSIPWRRFLPVLWEVISVSLFLWLFLSNVMLLGKMKKNRTLYGTRGNVKIYTVCGIQNPCLYGFLRPSIYLPYSLVSEEMGEKVSEEELEQIITHEFVHYRHRDHIWAMLRMLLVSIYWFNPFVWIAASYSKKDAELFCDETVIHLLGEEKRFCYGEMLVRLAGKTAWGDFRYSMLQMSRRGKEMERRIRAISGRRKYSKWMEAGIVSGTILRSLEKGTAGGEEDSISASKNRWADTPEEAFDRYMKIFTSAVNTGNISKMEQVLAKSREIYLQQCNLVKNYYKRGIREKVKGYSVSVREGENGCVEIDSKEKIKVSYADGESKIVKQSYRYICEQGIDGNNGWILTDMQEIQP